VGALDALRRRERLIAHVRWAVVAALLLQHGLGGPAPWTLAGPLALTGGLVAAAGRWAQTATAWRQVGAVALAVDGVVAVAHVAVAAGGGQGQGVTTLGLVLVVLEGALRHRLAGAVWTAGLTGGAAAAVALLAGSPPGVVVANSAGILLVAAFAGAFARELDVERQLFQRVAVATRDITARRDPGAILRAVADHVDQLVVTDRLMAYRHTSAGWEPVWDGAGPAAPDADEVAGGMSWTRQEGAAVARLVLPIRLPDQPTVHAVVATTRGPRPTALVEAVLRSLTEAAAVALATLDLISRQEATTVRLERLEALRTRFVATVAHDLRSPLTAVRGVAQLLRDRRDSVPRERVDEMLASVQRQADRLNRMADDLLDAARVDSDQLQLRREIVDVDELVHRVIDDVDVDVDVTVHGPAQVRGDAGRLERVVWNLLSNAVKYGRPPVQVAVRSGSDRVEVVVRDHGAGLTPDQRQSLFSAFASSADPDSVGLGLAIVYQLVAAHGGAVVYDDAGPGARFTVSLPLASATLPVTASSGDGPQDRARVSGLPPATR
jgi:signal transduction histidine kinase